MIRILLFLAVASAAAVFAAWFADRPGRVVIEWSDYIVETSFAVLLLAVAALVAFGIALFELARWLWRWPRRMRDARARKRLERGYQALTLGLVAAAAGDVAAARHYARQAGRLLEDERPGLLLLGAQTAQLEGDEEEALRRFRAMLREPEAALLGIRGLLAHAMKQGDLDRALELAQEAYRRSPSTPWVLATLFDLLTRAGRWREALAHLSELADTKVLEREEAARKRAILWLMLAREAEQRGETEEAFRLAQRAFRTQPAFAPVALQLSGLARRLGRTRLARRVLEKAWKLAPHPDLARAYAQLVPDEAPPARAARLERLRSLSPYAALSYLVLGEAYLIAGEFGQARTLLLRAAELGATVRTFQLLADLERLEHQDEEKAEAWLRRAQEAPLDEAWVCVESGEIFPEWRPFGANGGFDTVRWMRPPRVSRLALGQRPTQYLIGERPSPARAMVPRSEDGAPPAPAKPAPREDKASRAEPEADAA